MNAAPPRLGIERIARPRSVAVIGASEDARKFGGRVLRNVLHHRFAGRVVPINPNRPSLLGLPAFPSLKDARDPVDVAIIAVPQPLLEASLADCVAAGTGAAVIITSQFAEVGPEGAALQDRVVATARAAGMRLIGPNCLGYISPVASLALNSSPAMEGSTLEPGPIGLVSQSGALMATIYNRAVEDGARFSLAVSVGNQADLEAMDFVEFLVGDAAIVADRLTGAGHRLANLGAATREGLGRLYMPNQVGNPLDLGGRREGEYSAIARDTMTTLAAEPDVAAFLVVLTTAPMLDEIAAGLAAPAVATGKPTLFVVLPGTAGDAARRAVAAHGLLCVDTIDEALRVLDGWRAVGAAAPVAPAPSRPAGLPVTHPPTDRTGALTEPEAKALLAACGIALPAERVAADADGAAAAARAIGYPVVAKAIKRSLSHKSDAGGVALNLADETALRAAIAAMARLEPEAYLIAAMARGEAELILGLNHDPQFGPMVLAGFGGIHAELLADTALAPAPVSPARAEAMLRGLRLWPLLDGARGRPKLDVAAVVDALVRLSWLGHDLGPRLVELDVNPLIVGVKGVWALDARAMLA